MECREPSGMNLSSDQLRDSGRARPYDIVLLGAYGTYGTLAAEQLARLAPPHSRIGLAGRDTQKLGALLNHIQQLLYARDEQYDNSNQGSTAWAEAQLPQGDVVELVVGGLALKKAQGQRLRQAPPPLQDFSVYDEHIDMHDSTALLRMASRARVVASAMRADETGASDAVIDACVGAGAHYTDLQAKPGALLHILRRWDAPARSAGVILAPGCGFDYALPDAAAVLAERVLLELLEQPPQSPVQQPKRQEEKRRPMASYGEAWLEGARAKRDGRGWGTGATDGAEEVVMLTKVFTVRPGPRGLVLSTRWLEALLSLLAGGVAKKTRGPETLAPSTGGTAAAPSPEQQDAVRPVAPDGLEPACGGAAGPGHLLSYCAPLGSWTVPFPAGGPIASFFFARRRQLQPHGSSNPKSQPWLRHLQSSQSEPKQHQELRRMHQHQPEMRQQGDHVPLLRRHHVVVLDPRIVLPLPLPPPPRSLRLSTLLPPSQTIWRGALLMLMATPLLLLLLPPLLLILPPLLLLLLAPAVATVTLATAASAFVLVLVLPLLLIAVLTAVHPWVPAVLAAASRRLLLRAAPLLSWGLFTADEARARAAICNLRFCLIFTAKILSRGQGTGRTTPGGAASTHNPLPQAGSWGGAAAGDGSTRGVLLLRVAGPAAGRWCDLTAACLALAAVRLLEVAREAAVKGGAEPAAEVVASQEVKAARAVSVAESHALAPERPAPSCGEQAAMAAAVVDGRPAGKASWQHQDQDQVPQECTAASAVAGIPKARPGRGGFETPAQLLMFDMDTTVCSANGGGVGGGGSDGSLGWFFGRLHRELEVTVEVLPEVQ